MIRSDDGAAPLAAQLMIAKADDEAVRHIVDHRGTCVSWRQFGTGAPLVLLHGGHGSWMHWIRNVDALSKRFSLWIPDLPGFGESDSPAGAGLQDLLEPVIATLDQLVGEHTEIRMAGFSFGGLVAAHLAAARSRVSALALLGAAGHGGATRPRAALVNWRHCADEAELAKTMKHNLLVHMLFDPAGADELAVTVHTLSCIRTRFRSKELSRANGLEGALEQYRGDTLLLWGEHDVTAEPETLVARFGRGGRHRRAGLVGGGGHWIQYERHAEVNELLLQWFHAEQVSNSPQPDAGMALHKECE